ncbi:hypothetical protein [Paludisphaera borealis]|uniref:Uncharacterized protein n=1 Tax=Paludisphaera borealis TaxID=1387353 RepID=A0A1U7CR51_9BACT|nr:hypothetical protein [Paludisphaera borealis]APW61420.1 hypothetical protein BSF38_02934 [Paludisphaera borealis]
MSFRMSLTAVVLLAGGVNVQADPDEEQAKLDCGVNALFLLHRLEARHVTVLRPVGTRGTMVQVIDPPAPPWITDYDRLFINNVWTDRILIPRPPWYSPAGATGRMAMAGMASVVAASLATLWMQRRAG